MRDVAVPQTLPSGAAFSPSTFETREAELGKLDVASFAAWRAAREEGEREAAAQEEATESARKRARGGSEGGGGGGGCGSCGSGGSRVWSFFGR